MATVGACSLRLFLIGLLIYIAIVLIALLVLWFVIYTAVRAALTSHRQALAEERNGRL